MPTKEINNREDVFLLISTFYDRIKKDEFIGPFFLKTISPDQWDIHIEKLTDFWETNLFFVKKFKGNPLKTHKELDKKFDHSITQKHFGKWLELWISTIDRLYTGATAELAKDRARNIGFMLFLRIFEARQNNAT